MKKWRGEKDSEQRFYLCDCASQVMIELIEWKEVDWCDCAVSMRDHHPDIVEQWDECLIRKPAVEWELASGAGCK
jgi:hypothetical protein